MIKIFFFKKLILVSIIIIFTFCLGSQLVFSDYLDISQENIERGFPVRHSIDGDWSAGQSFIPNYEILTRAELSIRKMGEPDFDLTLELRQDNVNGNLIDFQTYTAESISNSFSWIEFNFTDVNIISMDAYYIVASLPPIGLNNSFGYEIGYAFNDPYLDGTSVYTNNTGDSWYEMADIDLAFKVYGYDEIEPIYPDLKLSFPESVQEENDFQVYVSSDDGLVSNALVVFSGLNYYTSSSGSVTIIAPSVNYDTIFTILASKTGYNSIDGVINVLNYQKTISDGFIYGIVTDISGKSIENATVCITSSEIDNLYNNCILTDSTGKYIFSVLEGIYNIEVSKIGYQKNFYLDAIVNSGFNTSINFQLEINESKVNNSTIKPTKSLLDYTILEEVRKGSIIGIVDVSSHENIVDLYDDNLSLEVLSNDIKTDQGVNIKISGEGASGTKILIYFGEIENQKNLIVLYDNVRINQTDDVELFLQKGYTESDYLLTTTVEDNVTKNMLIINIPTYSQHYINIYIEKTIDYLDRTTAILFYLGFLTLVAIIFIGIGTIRRRF